MRRAEKKFYSGATEGRGRGKKEKKKAQQVTRMDDVINLLSDLQHSAPPPPPKKSFKSIKMTMLEEISFVIYNQHIRGETSRTHISSKAEVNWE